MGKIDLNYYNSTPLTDSLAIQVNSRLRHENESIKKFLSELCGLAEHYNYGTILTTCYVIGWHVERKINPYNDT